MSLIHTEKEQEERRKRKFSGEQVAKDYVLGEARKIRVDNSGDAEFIGKLAGNLCINAAIDTAKARETFGAHFPVFWDSLSKADIILAYFSTTTFSLERPEEHPDGCIVYRTKDEELFSKTLLANENHLASFGERALPVIQGMLNHYLGYALLLPDAHLEKAVRDTNLLQKYNVELTLEEAANLPAFHEQEVYKVFRDDTPFHRIANDYLIGWESAPVGCPGNDKEIGNFSLDGVLSGNRIARRLRQVTIERLTSKEKLEAEELEKRCYFALVHSIDWEYYPKLKKIDAWRRPIHAAYFTQYCKARGV